MELYWKAITQERTDSDKVYSLHKPYTACIAKGKAHKKYEFGNKVGLMPPYPSSGTGDQSLRGQPARFEDHPTAARADSSRPASPCPKRSSMIGVDVDAKKPGVKVTTPDKAKAGDSKARKRRMRRRFRRRAGIEPIIGHLKTDHRMGQNYLHGKTSSQINACLAAAGWNLKKWIEQWERDGKKLLRLIWFYLTGIYSNKLLWSS